MICTCIILYNMFFEIKVMFRSAGFYVSFPSSDFVCVWRRYFLSLKKAFKTYLHSYHMLYYIIQQLLAMGILKNTGISCLEVSVSHFREIFKTQLDRVLVSLLWLRLLEQGGCTVWSQDTPCNLNSMMLWFCEIKLCICTAISQVSPSVFFFLFLKWHKQNTRLLFAL